MRRTQVNKLHFDARARVRKAGHLSDMGMPDHILNITTALASSVKACERHMRLPIAPASLRIAISKLFETLRGPARTYACLYMRNGIFCLQTVTQ